MDTNLVDYSQEQALTLSGTSSVSTDIKVDFVSADSIHVSYTNIPGNQPNTYGNMVALWQNSDSSIPWNTAPLATFSIPTNTPQGSFLFSGLTVTKNSYVIGYAVGPNLTGSGQQSNGNVCSSVFVPNADGPFPSFDASLTIKFVGSNSVAVGYALPDGIMPQSNGAYLAIWRSGSPSYNATPLAVAPVSLNAPTGTIGFNNLTIGIGLSYTIALFTSGYKSAAGPNTQTAMAAYVTFQS